MALKLAFLGFRHGHIYGLHGSAVKRDDVDVVAACEEDAAARKAVPASVTLTHDRYEALLDEVDCDAVAIGDYYGRRGSVAIEALKRGKHVISDKPLCTSLDELDQIESLAKEKGLTVGIQFDQTHSAQFNALAALVASGQLGDVHQVIVTGQHPLMYGKRAEWYFEEGKHGGTFNDIAVHAVHAMPWVFGKAFTSVIAARTWNAFATEVPHFMDSAQALLTMDGGLGVMMDVSYAMPTSSGYGVVQYWRYTVFGTKGVAETSVNMDHITLAEEGVKEVVKLPPASEVKLNYLDAFVSQCGGGSALSPLTTGEILKAQRQSLVLQQAADTAQRDVAM